MCRGTTGRECNVTALLPPCRCTATFSPQGASCQSKRSARPRRPPLTQEAVMGQPIPAQHPSVVLRSHFKLVRTLLILAMGALVALTAAVVILANDENNVDTASKATPAVQAQAQTQPGIRFDGGPDEGT